MARMPSPANSSPAPSLSFSTSLAKDRSAISASFRCRPRAAGTSNSNVVLADVLQHLLQNCDQRGIFGIVDAVEHGFESIVHGRPGAREQSAAVIGQEHMADTAVGDALLAPHEALAFQRAQCTAQGR